jgi:hypothetical protein
MERWVICWSASKQLMLMAPIMPNGDVDQSALSELSSQVVWHELQEIESLKMPAILHVHESLAE